MFNDVYISAIFRAKMIFKCLLSQYYTDNNYVVSTIYKLGPIQFMGAIEYFLDMYIPLNWKSD